jgi:membrane protein YqaA with SNARE-associated domain
MTRRTWIQSNFAPASVATLVTFLSSSLLPGRANAEPVGRAAQRAQAHEPARTAGWITIGSGVLSLGGAGLCFALGKREDDRVREDRRAGRMTDPDDLNSSESYAVAGLALGAVGLIAVGTGVTLVLLNPKTEPARQVTVAVTPRQMLLTGRF